MFIYLVPHEIKARGPGAKLAYQNALKTGKVKMYRARIMLIGQDRAGKTSLKKSFLGLPFDPEEESTDGIEVDPSKFKVDTDQVKNWKRTDEKLGVSQFASDIAKMVARDLQEIDDEAKEEENVAESDEENEIEEEREISLVEVNPCRKNKSGCKCRGALETIKTVGSVISSLQSQMARALHFKNKVGSFSTPVLTLRTPHFPPSQLCAEELWDGD